MGGVLPQERGHARFPLRSLSPALSMECVADFRHVGGCDECVALPVEKFNALLNMYRDELECLVSRRPDSTVCRHHYEAGGRQWYRCESLVYREQEWPNFCRIRREFESILKESKGGISNTPTCNARSAGHGEHPSTSNHCISGPSFSAGGSECSKNSTAPIDTSLINP